MAKEFSCWADTYEEAVGDLSRETWTLGILKEVLKRPAARPRILDVGGGTGIGARLLRSHIPCTISAIDQSPEMLSRSQKEFDEIHQQDFSLFDFRDSPFDLIVSGFDSLNYLSKQPLQSFFQSVARSLTPQGQLIFDYSSPHLLWEEWASKEYSQTLKHGVLRWKHRLLEETKGSEITLEYSSFDKTLIWSEHHIQFTHDTFEMHQLAHAAGLEILRVRNLKDEHYSPNRNTHVYCLALKN